MQDHHRTLLGLQAPEAAFELVAIGEGSRAVGGVRFSPDDPDLGGPAALVPTLVGAGVDDEPVEPRPEAVRITQSRQLSPCMHEGFLDRVLRAIPVAQDEPRDGIQAVGGSAREDLEGLMIAALCRLHQIALHRFSTGCATQRPRSYPTTDVEARTVQEQAWRPGYRRLTTAAGSVTIRP